MTGIPALSTSGKSQLTNVQRDSLATISLSPIVQFPLRPQLRVTLESVESITRNLWTKTFLFNFRINRWNDIIYRVIHLRLRILLHLLSEAPRALYSKSNIDVFCNKSSSISAQIFLNYYLEHKSLSIWTKDLFHHKIWTNQFLSWLNTLSNFLLWQLLLLLVTVPIYKASEGNLLGLLTSHYLQF